jgi:hemoglobin/transferrin/lactoferrin receptor protein
MAAIVGITLIGAAAPGADWPAAHAQPPTAPTPPASPPAADERPVDDVLAQFVFDEMTVTSTRSRRDPFLTPGETNLISRDEFDRTQAQSVSDVLRYQPGADWTGGPRRIGEEIVIRGLSGSRVLVTIDGARLNYQFGHKGKLFVDPDLLRQVEIVRGPVSALYGGGALGGVAALTTRDPEDFLGPDSRLSITGKLGYQGASDEVQTGPTIAARITDGLEVLLSYTYRNGGDIRLGGGDILRDSSETLHGGLFKTVWRPTPYDKVTLSALVGSEDGRVPTNTDSATADPTLISDRVTKQQIYRIGYEHYDPAVPWLDLGTNVYYTRLDVDEFRVSDRRPTETDFDTYGLDVRNASHFTVTGADTQVLTYGVEYYHDRQKSRQNGTPYVLIPDGTADVVGLYVQDEITLFQRVVLIPGLRWDQWQNERTGITVTESHLSPKVGVVVKATDFLFLEANYAQGFRPPNFGELFIAGTHFPGAVFIANPDLEPEKSENVDVGFRIRTERVFFEHDRFRFRNAYFWNTVEDFIDFNVGFTFPPPTLVFQAVNVQDALIQGYEMEAAYEPLPGLTLLVNYTRIRGEDRNTRQPLSSIPADKVVAGVDYRIAPIDVTIGARVQVVSDQHDVPAGVPRTDGYTIYDLFASWTPRFLRGLRVDAGIDNVTDERYRRHLATVPEAGINPKFAISYTQRW